MQTPKNTQPSTRYLTLISSFPLPFFPVVLLVASLSACQSQAAPVEENLSPSTVAAANPVDIRTATARVIDFPIRQISTGLLRCHQVSEIKSKISGQVQAFPFRQGDQIEKGALLAALDQKELELGLKQRLADLDRALTEKNDLLIGHYGKVPPDSIVPSELLEAFLIRSGYNQAEIAVEQARHQLEQAEIFAPFSGLIANLKVKSYQYINAGETICTLIDPNSYEVEFKLLEGEALKVKKGQGVEVRPTALPETSLRAVVVSINPLVDEQGLVTLKARLKMPAKQRLFEGMNVQVFLENLIPRQLVIPKSALVLRSGREVVFTYDVEAQRAKWNYVSVSHENDELIAIRDGLKAGDQVIIEGNLNLDHDAGVKPLR